MSKKTLNKTNLERLGAERLAELVLDLVKGNAALQRRARMELSASQGPKELAADLRRRFASLRRSTGFVDWRKQRTLVKDLSGLLGMIENAIAPHDADEAFELLWSFLQLAPSIQERTDDSNGAIGDVMSDAVDLIATVSPRISVDGKSLAERILDAVADAGYGEFDGIIPATVEALGDDGLEHLKEITAAWAAAPPSRHELDQVRGHGRFAPPEEIVRRNKQSTASVILADVADAQGDVDAYMARYSEEQLAYGTIAPDVAHRLLDADRIEEAFDIISRARAAEESKPFSPFRHKLDEIYEECLRRLGKTEDLKAHLWATFKRHLSASSLRKYLKLLPDFDDLEAEAAALDHAETYPDPGTAIRFLVDWPALDRAAQLVLSRADELLGDSDYTLPHAANMLEAEHPLAATLIRRAMVEDILEDGRSKRYRDAAHHLAQCESCAAAIADFGSAPTHEQFVASLKERHGRKYGFWRLVEA